MQFINDDFIFQGSKLSKLTWPRVKKCCPLLLNHDLPVISSILFEKVHSVSLAALRLDYCQTC